MLYALAPQAGILQRHTIDDALESISCSCSLAWDRLVVEYVTECRS